MAPEEFQHRLLQWFALHGRHDLPWQTDVSPYRVWISEIMLQQTQVSTVIPYFLRFMQACPDVEKLACAPLDEVLHLWSGLGYYARARSLHKAAALIAGQKRFPATLDEWVALPGIGRSTAGAILSIAFNDAHPILDGNVKRVLARFKAISGWPGLGPVSRKLWQISADYTPKRQVADYTQAIMDLGATLCTRKNPQCPRCPLADACLARQQQRVDELPTAKTSQKKPVKSCVFLALLDTGKQVLLEKRPAMGIWGGLWSFPEFTSLDAAQTWCMERGINIDRMQCLATRKHSFSHFHLHYTTLVVTSDNPKNNVMEGGRLLWYKTGSVEKIGLPAPVSRLLQEII